MFRHLKLRQEKPVEAEALVITQEQLERDAKLPIPLRQINQLPDEAKRRIYRSLIPPELLVQFEINPLTWKGSDGQEWLRLIAAEGSYKVNLTASLHAQHDDPFLVMELSDNTLNSIDLDLIQLNDPYAHRFQTDRDETGQDTLFGTLRRNLPQEVAAMQAGLAPAQVRTGLGGSGRVLAQIEVFLVVLGHTTYFLEPLTYASAWVFERRGFAYVRGHKLMDDIHKGFQPGGELLAALDGSTPFRQPEQARSIRGRAWAIHDGILEVLNTTWDGLRMVKQVGRQAGVQTSPEVAY
jgi:hypothetical protein